jgi:hypothetical protein
LRIANNLATLTAKTAGGLPEAAAGQHGGFKAGLVTLTRRRLPRRSPFQGQGKCKASENIRGLQPSALSKLVLRPILALRHFWLKWLRNGKESLKT